MNNKELGYFGQRMAVEFLEKKGYLILEENWTLQGAEIDLIIEKDNNVIFVEVKTRSTNSFGENMELISERQKEKLIYAAELYMQKKDVICDWQIDLVVVEVIREPLKVCDIVHFEDVIDD